MKVQIPNKINECLDPDSNNKNKGPDPKNKKMKVQILTKEN